MTIHCVTPGVGSSAERKARLGRCITPRCTRPPRTDERICARCRDRIWRSRHPEHHLWNNLKKSAKRRGIAFTITLPEFQAFAAAEQLVERVGRGPECATVDRIDATRGYEPGNLRILSNQENARLGGFLSGTGHRAPGQAMLPLSHYTPEENPLLC